MIFHFTMTSALEFIHICHSYAVGKLYNAVFLHISSRLCVQWWYFTFVDWNQARSEYLYHRNQQMLQIRAPLLPKCPLPPPSYSLSAHLWLCSAWSGGWGWGWQRLEGMEIFKKFIIWQNLQFFAASSPIFLHVKLFMGHYIRVKICIFLFSFSFFAHKHLDK